MNYADGLIREKNIQTVAICNRQEDGYSYVILSQTLNLRDYIKDLNEALCGRGGGKAEVIQGNFKETKENIENALLKTFAKG